MLIYSVCTCHFHPITFHFSIQLNFHFKRSGSWVMIKLFVYVYQVWFWTWYINLVSASDFWTTNVNKCIVISLQTEFEKSYLQQTCYWTIQILIGKNWVITNFNWFTFRLFKIHSKVLYISEAYVCCAWNNK